MTNIAVILAGGIGARVGGNTPKQLLPLADGRSILEHAVYAFEQSPHIHEVCIVMHPDYIAYAEQMLLANAWQKVRHIIPGGKERWESSVNAIRAYTPYTLHSTPVTNLLLHDAARPFVSQEIIASVCEACAHAQCHNRLWLANGMQSMPAHRKCPLRAPWCMLLLSMASGKPVAFVHA